MQIDFEGTTPFTRWMDKINRKFGRPDYRELIILAGLASSGKTEFSYWMARKNIEAWNKVCFISLELPEYDMKLRICRKKAGVWKLEFQDKKYTTIQKQIMENERSKLEQLKDLKIICPEVKDLGWIEKAIRESYDEWFRLFVIDNLDKISLEKWTDDNNYRQKEITNALQNLKNDSNICIILLHHLKKPPANGRYNQGWSSQISWTQKTIDNATQVFELHRDLDPELEDPKEKANVLLIQHKDSAEWANWLVNIYFRKWEYIPEWIDKREADVPF